MPTLEDVELTSRQEQFADAALALLAREGMAAVTFRAVAAEAGWSLGAMQKAFATKAELDRAMFSRLRESGVALPPTEPGRPTLRGWLVELFLSVMPLDERRRALELQGAAFAERAAYDARIGAAIAASDGEIRESIARLVRRAQGEGEVAAGVDPQAVAVLMLALAQGLATQLLYEPRPEDAVRELLSRAVGALLADAAGG